MSDPGDETPEASGCANVVFTQRHHGLSARVEFEDGRYFEACGETRAEASRNLLELVEAGSVSKLLAIKGQKTKMPEFHENPIIDALLTEASEAAMDAIIGGEATVWPEELGEMERDVTGCANERVWAELAERLFPVQNFVGPAENRLNTKMLRPAGQPYFKLTADMRRVLQVAELLSVDPPQWRETLEKARQFNAIPDTHDEWRSLNENER